MGLLDFITGGNKSGSQWGDVPFGLRLMVAGNMASHMAQGQAPGMGGYVAMEEARRNAMATRQEEEEYKKRMAMAARMAGKLRETNPLMADAIEANPELIDKFLPTLVDRQFQEQDYTRDRADKAADAEAARGHAFAIQDDSQAAQAERDRLQRGWSEEDAQKQYERDLQKKREELQLEEDARRKRIEETLGKDFFNEDPGPQSSNKPDEYGISPVARAALTPKPLPTDPWQVASLSEVPMPSSAKPAAQQVAEAGGDKITSKVRTMFNDDSISPSEAKLIMYKFLQKGDLGEASDAYNTILDNRTNRSATSNSKYVVPEGAYITNPDEVEKGAVPKIEYFEGTAGWKNIQEQKIKDAESTAKAQEAAEKQRASEALSKVNSLKVMKTIKEAKGRVKSGIQGAQDNPLGIDTVTGPIGGLIAGIPGIGPSTTAGQLAADIQTINANQAFDQLKAMRDASTSGASGLGQVTEFEQKMLMSVNEYLQQAAGGEDLYERLGNLELWYAAALKGTPEDPTKSVLQNDIELLRSEPTEENIQEFESIYGTGTAPIILVE